MLYYSCYRILILEKECASENQIKTIREQEIKVVPHNIHLKGHSLGLLQLATYSACKLER